MREYLAEFFKENGYDSEDGELFLGIYDKIVSCDKASKVFFDALSRYEADVNVNYGEEIIKRARTLADIVSVHPYTTELLVFICMTKHLRALYVEKGIDLQIFRDSVSDLKWKLWECKAVKGIIGSFVAHWFPGFFNLTRFALGRLQFEVRLSSVDYEGGGVKLIKDVSKVINVHIPRTCTPLDKESCDRAYAAAREFFKGEVGENAVFVCHSWLLFPKNKEILKPTSNVVRFMSEYDIIEVGFNDGNDLWRLFDTQEQNPYRLPTDSSMRRAYVEMLKRGERPGWGYGVKTS